MWFLESMATQILVVFVILTNGWPWHSALHPMLVMSSLLALATAAALPFVPAGDGFGFVQPTAQQCSAIVLVVATYLLSAEALKRLAIEAVGRLSKQLTLHRDSRVA